MDTQAIARRLRQAREETGLGVVAAATLAETSRTVWWRYENGRRLPDLEKLAAFCQATGFRLDWIIAGRRPRRWRD